MCHLYGSIIRKSLEKNYMLQQSATKCATNWCNIKRKGEWRLGSLCDKCMYVSEFVNLEVCEFKVKETGCLGEILSM